MCPSTREYPNLNMVSLRTVLLFLRCWSVMAFFMIFCWSRCRVIGVKSHLEKVRTPCFFVEDGFEVSEEVFGEDGGGFGIA